MEILRIVMAAILVMVITWCLFLRSMKRAQFVRMIEKIPGPRAYPLVGTLLPFLFTKRDAMFAEGQKVMRQHCPLYRMWIGPVAEVNILRPEHAEEVLGSTKLLDKSYVYRFLENWLGTGLLTATGQKWHSHRKMITPTFHFKILDNFVEVFSEKSEILVDKLQKEVGSAGFDVYPYITKCALDIICETAMGTPIHAQRDVSSEYVRAIYDMGELFIQRILRPWLHPDFLFKLSSYGRRHGHCLQVLHGFTNKVIEERKKEITRASDCFNSGSDDEDVGGRARRKAFLDLLLEASVDGVKLTDEELREEVDTFMFEGHDTVSVAMSWAILLLGLHPQVQELAYKEQEEIFQGSDRSCTMKDLNEMKYLERVIKESLRLYPSVSSVGRVVKQDTKIGSYTMPAGCTFSVQIYNVHRNPDQFPDPEKFDPDRFLPERVAKRHPYAYIPFSAGPRNCIGQKFALLEEKTVLSYILRRYRLTSLDKREDVVILSELVLRPANGIRVALSARTNEQLDV